MEKGSRFVIAILFDLLNRFWSNEHYDKLLIWSDCGPNFRCSSFMGTCCKDVMEAFPGIEQIDLEYGAPKHFKSVCDGKFGSIQRAKKNAAHNQVIREVEQLQEIDTNEFEERFAMTEQIPKEEYLVFMPPIKMSVPLTTMKLASAQAPIMSCFSWNLRRLGRRRRPLVGRCGLANTLTGIHLKANLLTGFSDKVDRKGHPEIDCNAKGQELAQEDDGPHFKDNGILQHSVKVHHGWRPHSGQSYFEFRILNLEFRILNFEFMILNCVFIVLNWNF